jgi:hypothetical protein
MSAQAVAQSTGPKENVVVDIGSAARVRWMLYGSMRSVAFLTQYLAWETVNGNAFGWKIGSESRSRRFSGRQQMPAARLEWSRGNLKFRGGTLRHQGENRCPHGNFLANRF